MRYRELAPEVKVLLIFVTVFWQCVYRGLFQVIGL